MTATLFVFAGWRHTRGSLMSPKVVVLVAWLGCVLRGVGVGGYTKLRDKSVFVLVHCWVSGAALVVPVGPYVHG